MKFFILGDRKMMYLKPALLNDPDFGGFLIDSANIFDFERRVRSSYSNKQISFKNFLRYSKANGANLVLYYNDIVGSKLFRNYLYSLSNEFCFNIKDFFEFSFYKNIPLVYDTPQDLVNQICYRKKDWEILAERVSDQFSKESIKAYLRAIEKKSIDEMIPYVVPFDFESFNKYSNHFSFMPTDDEIFVDIGAYDGDSVAKFIESTPTGGYREIHAFEPNKSTYAQLVLRKQWIPRLFTYELALSNQNSFSIFNNDGGSMGARLYDGNAEVFNENDCCKVQTVRLDDVLKNATFIKMDVEGFEKNVVDGAKELIRKCSPTLVIDTYHHANDALEIYEAVMNIHKYSFVGMRFVHANLHAHSLYFSDTKNLV